MSEKRLTIRNSTAEFLIFTSQADADGIEVRVEDENVWLTQKLIAKLFDVVKSNISEHLKAIFDSNELSKEATVRKFRTVQTEENRRITRKYRALQLRGNNSSSGLRIKCP